MIKPSKIIRHGHSFDINSSDKGQTSCGTRRLETLLNFPIRHIKRIFDYVHINLPMVPKFNNNSKQTRQ